MLRKTTYNYPYNTSKGMPDDKLKNLCFELDSLLILIDGQLSKLNSSKEVSEDITLRTFIKSFVFILRQLLDGACLFMYYKDKNVYPKAFTSWYVKYNDPKFKNSEDWIIKDFYNIVLDQHKSHWFKFYRDLIKLDYPLEVSNDETGNLKIIIYYKNTDFRIPSDYKIPSPEERMIRNSIEFDNFISVFEGIKVWIHRSKM